MIYTAFSLNGTWEMYYREERYTGTKCPLESFRENRDIAGTEPENSSNHVIENAVPGYWEDMTAAFRETPFFRALRINPEYGLQQYPLAGGAPDMALPNIVGNFFYRRMFFCESALENAVVHFEGVQNAVSVWINEVFLGRHEGYSTPFDISIPAGVLRLGANTVVLSVSNHRLEGYAGEPVSGLTSRAANECTGGITGDVELRVYRSPLRDVALFVAENCETVTVHPELEGREASFLWKVWDGEKLLKSGESRGAFAFDTQGMELWSPENPKRYRLELLCGEATLERLFGVRRLLPDGVHFRLNGVPYYLRGVCEHCYFPETVHPVHDREFYRNIIRKLKSLGFNFIRFHTFVPAPEYLEAADELGMLVHVESPNNTSLEEWQKIVNFCRRYTCAVIYCCGNELLMDEPFIAHLHRCGDCVHENTDALFSPMSALRGLEYFWVEPDQEPETRELPFKHHPRRIREVGAFSDLFSSYPNGQHSYFSQDADPEAVDAWSAVYNKPRVTHEICINGTYTDLSLRDRYRNSRIGKTDMFDSLQRHLEQKGLLQNAPVYFQNSCQWQRRVRKYCFEAVRRSRNIAGYDFLGPIDTHWHTFGYDVGMMNEFYELKPGETLRNVRMYNSATVLLHNLGRKSNFLSGETLNCHILASHYGVADLSEGLLTVRLMLEDQVLERQVIRTATVKNGAVNTLASLSIPLPQVERPGAMKLYVTLDGGSLFAENEWELYLFPEAKATDADKETLVISQGMPLEELIQQLRDGKNVLLFGTEPFASLPTSFQIALAGRTSGNLATVIHPHPALEDMPQEGFCGWQFAGMLEGGAAVLFESDEVPFAPAIEVVSTHKYAIRQAALFEFQALGGRLMVCGLRLDPEDPAAQWLKAQLVHYMMAGNFAPTHVLDEAGLRALAKRKTKKLESNTNFAFNVNDKTAIRKGRKP